MSSGRKIETKPVAMIAGASRGIGKAVALRLAREGWDLALAARARKGRSELERLADSCRKLGARVLPIPGDLGVPGKAEFAVAETIWVLGRLDALVHCAGDYSESSLAKQSFAEWKQLFQSNLDTAFLTAQAAVPALRKRRSGRIVFLGMAGISSLRPRTTCAAYTAAKTALLVYARSLAVEEARNGITVNVVSPGVIPHEDSHPSARDRRLWKKVPLGRPGKPEDVAGAVSFLLSENSSYFTGGEIPVSGGWMS